MSEIVSLELPSGLATQVRALAMAQGRQVEDVLIAWIDQVVSTTPLDGLPDVQILALADAQLDASQQAELSDLLADQREGCGSPEDRQRLEVLIQAYRHMLVRKAQALHIAVDRGLRPRLD